MKNKVKRIGILIVLLFLIVEVPTPKIRHSSVFTSSGNTEIKLYVIVNTLLPVNESIMTKEIISEEQKINGAKENPVYKLILYRTPIHYRNEWEYDSVICDENGAIICDGNDSVL